MTDDWIYYLLAKRLFEMAKEAREAGDLTLAESLSEIALDAIEQAIELVKKEKARQ